MPQTGLHDALILGAGPGGCVAAMRAAHLGLSADKNTLRVSITLGDARRKDIYG